MNFYHSCISVLLICVAKEVSPIPAKHWTHHWTCPSNNRFQYNLCHDPAHPDTTFTEESNTCDISSELKENLRIQTLKSRDDLLEGITNFNPVTNVYFKMARFLRMFHKLWCLYSSRAEQQCCLPFSRTFNRLKHRLLSKWWLVQNSCGQAIDQSSCDETVPVFTNNNFRCEELRYIIYILLQDARTLLNESLLVAEQI